MPSAARSSRSGHCSIKSMRTLKRSASRSMGSFIMRWFGWPRSPRWRHITDELRDRALQSLARRLRQGVEGYQSAPALVAALLGRTKLWPTAVVSDAEFAATTEQKRARAGAAAPTHDPRMTRVQIERGIVTAVCQSKVTGELFLGFAGGQVIAYRADRNQVVKVGEGAGTVAGLAVDPTGQTLVTLRQFDREAVLSSFRKHPDGSYRHRPDVHFSVSPQSWLTPVLPLGVERLVGLSDGRDLHIIDAASGIFWQRRRISASAPRARGPPSCFQRIRRPLRRTAGS